MKMKRKAQVWIETVIYTLIGLSVIGLVLAFATPKIEAIRDKAVIEQSINVLSDIDSKIVEMSVAIGNTRTLSISLKKGELVFDCLNNRVEFNLKDSSYVYSEPNQKMDLMDLSLGKIEGITEQGRQTDVKLWIDYKGKLDLKCNGEEGKIILPKASAQYKILLNNKDLVDGENIIDISIS